MNGEIIMGYAVFQSTTTFNQVTEKEAMLEELRDKVAKYIGFGLTNTTFYTYGVCRVLKLETLEFHYDQKLLADPLNMIQVFSDGKQVANGHMSFTFKDKLKNVSTYEAHMTHLFSKPLESEQEFFLLQKTEQEFRRFPGFLEAYKAFLTKMTEKNSHTSTEKTYALSHEHTFDKRALAALKENEPKLSKYFRIKEENQSLIQTVISKNGEFDYHFLYSLSDARRPKDSFGNLYMVNYYLVKTSDTSQLLEVAKQIADLQHQQFQQNQTTATLDCQLAELYATLRHLELKAQNTLV